MKLSNQPPKGTSDWLPNEYAKRKYIFDTWRRVCTSFGYEEYLTPILESADVYRAKSGEDVGGKELMTMQDRAGRELAIRPEMTPSVTRMVTKIYNDTPKPIRLFSIANYFRNEKPQRGRNREFWQLNFDIFGSDSLSADVEILQMAVEIMRAFGANEEQFVIYVNHKDILRLLVRSYFQIEEKNFVEAVRIIDKFNKISLTEFQTKMKSLGMQIYDDNQFWNTFSGFMNGSSSDMDFIINRYIKGSDSYNNFENILEKITQLGLDLYVKWSPSLARGFDYYDGMVFEVFDKNTENNRAMFGGGRYNGLASIFGSQSFPAIGCAPGDETTKLFLESWNLMPDLRKQNSEVRYFVPLLDASLITDVQQIAQNLRNEGFAVEVGMDVQKLGKALDYANKKEIGNVVIFGEDEKRNGVYKLKNMGSGEEREEKC